jgi:hypothetical protein
MVKVVTCKCVLFSLLCLAPSSYAGELKSIKLRSLTTTITKDKHKESKKQRFIKKVNEFFNDEIDVSIFDKKKDGLSVYAKISRVSKLGVRYRF